MSRALVPDAATQELVLVYIYRGKAGVQSGDGNLLYCFYPKLYMAHRCWVFVFVFFLVLFASLLSILSFKVV